MDDVRLSKFLSLVLRHQPEKIGLLLDPSGWAEVDALIAACQKHQIPLTRDRLEQIVADNDKQRFEFDEAGLRIRASQGHSVPVDLGYAREVPPELLYHGTAEKFISSIRVQGLLKGKRHHVHLSTDPIMAGKVGSRRGASVILTVQAGAMHRAGHEFFISTNGVWLTERVPAEFLLQ